MNIKLCLRCVYWCVFSRIPILWRLDKVVRQRRGRTTSRHSFITAVWWYNILYHLQCRVFSLISKEIVHYNELSCILYLVLSIINKGNNKITEHRAIFQRERQNAYVNKQTRSVNNRKTGKTAMALTWYRHFQRIYYT
jgi:hypothetical protein